MGLRADLHVRRGAFEVRTRIDADDGATVALLGPNGAGKSTVLEALAGVVPLTGGAIVVDDAAIDGSPPERRPIGISFQDPVLFPTMSVLENVAFPLRARGVARSLARDRAGALLRELVRGVDPDARPSSLSGGQAQRVALARALIAEPRLLLLDEPLSAVDVHARAELRILLREVIARFRGVTVLVAHDPVDALTLADQVVILEDGRTTQTGTPEEIRAAPATSYAAELVGVNLFVGRLSPIGEGASELVTDDGTLVVPVEVRLPQDDVIATLSPSEIVLHLDQPEGSARNVFEGQISEIVRVGNRARVRLRSTPPLVAEITLGSLERLALVPGQRVFASCKSLEVHVHDRGAQDVATGTLDG